MPREAHVHQERGCWGKMRSNHHNHNLHEVFGQTIEAWKHQGDVAMELWTRLVNMMLEKTWRIKESAEQYGFLPRKRTTEAVFLLRLLIEKGGVRVCEKGAHGGSGIRSEHLLLLW